MIASGLPISGCSPKFWVSPASVGAAVLWTPSSPVRTRAIVPLPERFGPTQQLHLLLRRVAREHVAEPLGERLASTPRRRPRARRGTAASEPGSARPGRTRTGARAARRTPGVCGSQLAVSRSSRIPFASGTISPALIGVVAVAVEPDGRLHASRRCARSPSAPRARSRSCTCSARTGRARAARLLDSFQ